MKICKSHGDVSGQVSMFRSRVRTAAPCLTLLLCALVAGAAEFPQGLMVQFNFDEYSSGYISDRTGRGHDGRAAGCYWSQFGKRSGCYEFYATNGVITVTNRPSLQLGKITLSSWFRAGGAGTNAAARYIFEKNPASGYAMGIAGNANKGRAFATVNGKTCIGDSNVTDGVWHHMAATFDGENLKLYVDGVPQKQTVALKGEVGANTNSLHIGMNKNSPAAAELNRSFDGALDDMLIFNKGITGDEVLAVIASIKPKFSKYEVQRRLAELKELLDRGLILQEFYDRKVKECETN